MFNVYDRAESDGYSSFESENDATPEASGWETEDSLPDKRSKIKITKEIINLASKKISLDYIFKTRYKIDFEEKYSPSGWSFVRSCPFPDHRDSNPSFNYNKEEDRFFCFGCNKGGKSVQFVSYIEKISLSEAAEILLKQAGITSDIIIESNNEISSKVDEILLNFSNDIYNFLLLNKDNKGLSFAERTTELLDIYLQKHLPRSTIDETNLLERVRKLKLRLQSYVK